MHIMFRMCVLVIMALLVRTVSAFENIQQAGVSGTGAQLTGVPFSTAPEWREKKVARSDIVPPPPAGPYMSTALTPMPGAYGPESGIEQNAGTEMAGSPFFMSDMQWPNEQRQPPRRWMPEKGQYQYVTEKVLEQQKQLETGYSRNYPPMQPWRANTRPVFHSRPVVERPYRGGSSVFGNN